MKFRNPRREAIIFSKRIKLVRNKKKTKIEEGRSKSGHHDKSHSSISVTKTSNRGGSTQPKLKRNKSKLIGIKEQPNIPKTKNTKVVEDLEQIMIVDDNMFNLQTLQTMIKLKFKQASIIASSGEIALEFVNKRIKLN